MNKEKIDKLVNGSDVLLIATQKGVGAVGTKVDLLTLLAVIVKHLHEDCKIEKELIQKVVEKGFKDNKEIKKELINILEKLFDGVLEDE